MRRGVFRQGFQHYEVVDGALEAGIGNAPARFAPQVVASGENLVMSLLGYADRELPVGAGGAPGSGAGTQAQPGGNPAGQLREHRYTRVLHSLKQKEIPVDAKLTVRVPRHLLENAKRDASENNTTLTELISTYLKQIPIEGSGLDNAPIVRRLTGSLSQNITVGDYMKHLEGKYGGQ
jgi:hypothetical protein